MKAISIKQPWAAAIMLGEKTIETRTWATEYRGPLLIVASKMPDKAMLEYTASLYADLEARKRYLNNLQYGKAIAIADLAECRPMKSSDMDAAMCDLYAAFSWVLKSIRPIEPFPVKGQLGIYDVNIGMSQLKFLEKANEQNN